MIRRRLYNPAQLTPDELKASFVAREDTLEEMLRLLAEQTPGRPCQHMMLIGPRGMGKTTLGLRFLHSVAETPDLAAAWQPVPFYEESYGIVDLADFWLAALDHLTRATDEPEWAGRADALTREERDGERLAAYAIAALMDYCQRTGKRLILFVENLDAIFGQVRNEREIHALRANLIERPEILLLGSANTVFEAIRAHDRPFYEFFRLFFLRGIGTEETGRLLDMFAGREGRPDISQALIHERGRLETLRRLTDGNPRLLVLACRILMETPLGEAIEDLEQLIDEQTPYFKARIEELAPQARKVFHCLADGWKPMLAKGGGRRRQADLIARQRPDPAIGGPGLRTRGQTPEREASPLRSRRPVLQHLLSAAFLTLQPTPPGTARRLSSRTVRNEQHADDVPRPVGDTAHERSAH